MTNQKMKDAQQTATCHRIHMHLRSMASLAVEAQDTVGNPDKLQDTLDLIQHDLAILLKLTDELARDTFSTSTARMTLTEARALVAQLGSGRIVVDPSLGWTMDDNRFNVDHPQHAELGLHTAVYLVVMGGAR